MSWTKWGIALVFGLAALIYVLFNTVFAPQYVAVTDEPQRYSSPMYLDESAYTQVNCRLDLCVGFPEAWGLVANSLYQVEIIDFEDQNVHLRGEFAFDRIDQVILTQFDAPITILHVADGFATTVSVDPVDFSATLVSREPVASTPPQSPADPADGDPVNGEPIAGSAGPTLVELPAVSNVADDGRMVVTSRVAPAEDGMGQVAGSGNPNASGGFFADVSTLVTENIANFILAMCGLLILVLGAIRFIGPTRQSELAEKYIGRLGTFTAGAVTTILSAGASAGA